MRVSEARITTCSVMRRARLAVIAQHQQSIACQHQAVCHYKRQPSYILLDCI